VGNPNSGIFVPYHNHDYTPDFLALHSGFLMKNKARAEKIASRGRKRVLDNFSVERVALKIYNSMAK